MKPIVWCTEIWQWNPQLSLGLTWAKRSFVKMRCGSKTVIRIKQLTDLSLAKWFTFHFSLVKRLLINSAHSNPKGSLPICKPKEGGCGLDCVLTVFLTLIFVSSKTFKGASPESWDLLVHYCQTLESLSSEEQTAERTKNAWLREGSRQYDQQEVSEGLGCGRKEAGSGCLLKLAQ